MRDVIWTIIICWVIWKLWSMIKSARTVVIQKNEQHEHHHHYHSEQEGATKVEQLNSGKQKIFRDTEGEYVDFEEIKK